MRTKLTVSTTLALVALAVTVFFLAKNKFNKTPLTSTDPPPPPPVESTPPPPEDLPPPKPPLANRLLENYASAGATFQEDTILLHNVLRNVFLLVKKRDPRHYATNPDLVEFLIGNNNNRETYLTPPHPILNRDNLLIDRFGTPLHFHPISKDLLQIRSAGPDTILFTEDDFTYPPDPSSTAG
ncbi:MAG: hypothetical protein AAGC74_12445 [Verrucomicrobiota bacterium]